MTIHPQQCTIQQLRDAWRHADSLGVDSIWIWDHFYPLYGNPNGSLTSGTFGQITSANGNYPERMIRLGLRLQF